MKQRVISGAFCVIILAVVLALYNTLVLEAAISILSAVAVYELLSANGFKENKLFLFLGIVTAFLMPYICTIKFVPALIVAFLVLTVIFNLKYHSKISFDKVCYFVIVSIGISLSFSSIILMRNNFEKIGLLYILIAFGGAWFADTGAYFFGSMFGKHKLSPIISPKKTVEGAIGGVISNVLLICLLSFVYSKFTLVNINYFVMIVIAIVTAFAGMAGDLTASIIKRQIGIKDYGKVIPGHGGIMDRFDSISFTAPIVYIVAKFAEIIL